MAWNKHPYSHNFNFCCLFPGVADLQQRASDALANLKSLKSRLAEKRKVTAAAEHRQNFAPYVGKGKQRAHARPSGSNPPPPKRQQWTHKFLCVPSCSAKTAPRKGSERQLLISAGLWEKSVTFPNMDCSPEEYRDQLLEAFPKLKDAGGYEFTRCIPNSNQLECLPPRALLSPRNTQECVGKSKVYIRPIQKDLSITPLEVDLDGPYVSVCIVCLSAADFSSTYA